MTRVYLLLGSNLGDREKKLRFAVRELARLPKTKLIKQSRIYETEPVGPSSSPYLNMAVALSTALSPMGLLIETKALEAKAGRRPGIRWGSRVLDIDIGVYGRINMRSHWLRLPHPRINERAFALAPLADLDARYKARLKRVGGNVKIYSSHGL